MQKLVGKGRLLSVQVLIAITVSAMLCGCTTESPATNGTSPVPSLTPGDQLPPGFSATTNAGGRVYLDGTAVTGAQVEALSSDGTDRGSATTD